ncbi:hypothetical protein LAUMK4_01789 [Mycobacterium persicum]|uniref:Secreted protein n=1 Tax=Mycobacterium persicum TaxID=1487726 RepID=A0AB38URY8_9MYCO|nr:hypothetical protein LAUMK15_02152 [Mycobacterium persicum]VAZ83191.1 hypothetical protein LAUMK42_02004 [Mycobacterium persicum]VAZ91462.1 hypothetical protein LAUMK4_01789 [Mycobacterium persicum]
MAVPAAVRAVAVALQASVAAQEGSTRDLAESRAAPAASRASDAVPVTRSSLLIQVCDSAGSMTSSSSNVVAERNAFPC